MSHNKTVNECINELMEACAREKSPVFLTVQDTPRSYRTLCLNEQHAMGNQLTLLRILIKSGDIDSFLRNIIREAQHQGHDSLFLKAMGIAEKRS